jgi:hypothetical protein
MNFALIILYAGIDCPFAKTVLMRLPPNKPDGMLTREGVVVKLVVERDRPKTGRFILKYISDRYLFGKVSEQDTTDV